MTPDALLFAGTVLAALLALMGGRRSAAAAEVESLGRRLDRQASRIDDLEEEVEQWRDYAFKLRGDLWRANVHTTAVPPQRPSPRRSDDA